MSLATEAKAKLVHGAFRVMQSRHFVTLLQDKRVLGFLVNGMSLRARLRLLLRESGMAAAHVFGLATLEDLRTLEGELLEHVSSRAVSAPRTWRAVDRVDRDEERPLPG